MATRSYRGEIEAQIPVLRQSARALVGLGRSEMADDLVHDVLAHALKTERNWLGEDVALRLFGRLIVVNRARQRAEHTERRSGYPAQSGVTQRPPASHGVDSIESGNTGPLGILTLDEREALVLVVLGRLDHPLAAQALGIPIASLVSRLTQARERLGTSLWRAPKTTTVAGLPPHRSIGRSASHLRLVKS